MTLPKLTLCTLLIGYLPCWLWAGYTGRRVKVAGLARVIALAIAALILDCLLLIPAFGLWLLNQ